MRTNLPPTDVTRLLVKQARRALGAEDLVQWAVDRLLAGCETPALIQLAGLDLDRIPTLSDAIPVFRRALDDLKSARTCRRKRSCGFTFVSSRASFSGMRRTLLYWSRG